MPREKFLTPTTSTQIVPPSPTPPPEEIVALHCRVSTDEQNLDRQRELTYEYATECLGVSPSAIEVYVDERTGTNTDR